MTSKVQVNEDNMRESGVWRRTDRSGASSGSGSGKKGNNSPSNGDRTKEVKGKRAFSLVLSRYYQMMV